MPRVLIIFMLLVGMFPQMGAAADAVGSLDLDELSHQSPSSAWLEKEDAADALTDLDARIAALQDLRRDVIATGESAGTPLQRRRVEAKLALAIRRRAVSQTNLHERREMAREAARIGTLHLQEDDPERAARFEEEVERIESSSPATALLRNAIRQWFRERNDAILQQPASPAKWEAARKHLRRWQQVLDEDRSTATGSNEFAKVRSQTILEQSSVDEAEETLELLNRETQWLPDQPAWEDARRQIRADLVGEVQKARTRLRPDEMADALARLERLFPQEQQLPELYEGYHDLIVSTRPKLIDRDYGAARNATLQVTGDIYVGSSSISSDGNEVRQDVDVGVTLRGEWRLLSERPFDRGNPNLDLAATDTVRPWWVGLGIDGTWVQSKTELDDATAWLARGTLLLGRRFGRSNFSIGAGAGMQLHEIDLDVEPQRYDKLTVVPGYEFNMEYARNRSWVWYMNLGFSGADELSYFVGRFGLRYHPDPRVAFRFGVMGASSEIPLDEEDPESHEVLVTGGGMTFGMNIQF